MSDEIQHTHYEPGESVYDQWTVKKLIELCEEQEAVMRELAAALWDVLENGHDPVVNREYRAGEAALARYSALCNDSTPSNAKPLTVTQDENNGHTTSEQAYRSHIADNLARKSDAIGLYDE